MFVTTYVLSALVIAQITYLIKLARKHNRASQEQEQNGEEAIRPEGDGGEGKKPKKDDDEKPPRSNPCGKVSSRQVTCR